MEAHLVGDSGARFKDSCIADETLVVRVDRRSLTNVERHVLERLLSEDFPGVEQLRVQASHAEVVGVCDCGCPTIDLVVTGAPIAEALIDSRVAPVELDIGPDEEGAPGTILVFLRDGLIESLEYVYYSTDVPTTWPDPSRLTAEHR